MMSIERLTALETFVLAWSHDGGKGGRKCIV